MTPVISSLTWKGNSASAPATSMPSAMPPTAPPRAAPVDVKDKDVYNTSVAMDADGDFVVAWGQGIPDLPARGGGLTASSTIGARQRPGQAFSPTTASLVGKEILVDLSLTNPTPISGAFNPPGPGGWR